MNRCFEALERADISQALDTALQPPRQSVAFLCFAHSPSKDGCEAGSMSSEHVGRWGAREVQGHCKGSPGSQTLHSSCPWRGQTWLRDLPPFLGHRQGSQCY